jgi:hypothetical protein
MTHPTNPHPTQTFTATATTSGRQHRNLAAADPTGPAGPVGSVDPCSVAWPTPVPQTEVWTAQRIHALGAVTDLPTAGAILGLSRTAAYDLAKQHRFPVPVLRAGTRYRVPVAPILAALHLPTAPHQQPAGRGLDPARAPSVDRPAESEPARCPTCHQPPPAGGWPTPGRTQ